MQSGFNTLYYDAERRGIKPSARIKDIVNNGLEVRNVVEVKEEMPDPKDVIFYAVTLTTRDKDTFLVTGNGKHFTAKSFIVTPAELMDILEANVRLMVRCAWQYGR